MKHEWLQNRKCGNVTGHDEQELDGPSGKYRKSALVKWKNLVWKLKKEFEMLIVLLHFESLGKKQDEVSTSDCFLET